MSAPCLEAANQWCPPRSAAAVAVPVDEKTEDALVPISALQHHLCCPRQCALIHVERIWVEDGATGGAHGGCDRRSLLDMCCPVRLEKPPRIAAWLARQVAD